MRILRLDLLAFGCFTARQLSFAPTGLHLVYGPNEAGKSTALRATAAWLFGFERSKADDFQHNADKLRVGGLLEGRDTRLECIRRRGQKATLRDAADRDPIDDDVLAALVGGLDRDAFFRRFAIDFERLREGGAEILRGAGELGATLFGAGAGVAGVARLQQQLADEAERLFKPRGTTQEIKKSLKAHQEATLRVNQLSLTAAQFLECQRHIAHIEARLAELESNARKLRAEQRANERLQGALTDAARRRARLEQLEALDQAPRLAADFAARRGQVQRDLVAVTTRLAADDVTRQSLARKLAALPAQSPLLDVGAAIAALVRRQGSHQQALDDRPGLRVERETAESRALSLLQELGQPGCDLAEATALHLPRAARAQIDALAEQRVQLRERQKLWEQAAAEQTRRREAVDHELSELQEPPDPAPLLAACRRAEQHRADDKRRRALAAEAETLARDATVKLGQLRGWGDRSLAELLDVVTPSTPSVDRFDERFAAAQADLQRADDERTRLAAELAQLEEQIEAIRLGHDVPTEDDLAAARAARGAGWRLVRHRWLENGAAAADEAEFVARFSAASGDLAAAYEASVAAADDVADRLRREADRAASKASFLARQRLILQRCDAAEAERLAAGERCDKLDAAWRDEWRRSGVEPLTPREMRGWLEQRRVLCDLAAAQRKVAGEQAEIERSLAESRDELLAALRAVDAPASDPHAAWSALVSAAGDLAPRLESRYRRRQELAAEQLRLAEQRAAHQREGDALTREEREWRERWGQAVAAVGLDASAEPEAARSQLAGSHELQQLVDQARSAAVRLQQIDEHIATFAADVRGLVAAAAPKLLDAPPDVAVSELERSLAEAREIETLRRAINEQLESLEQTRDEQQAQQAVHEEALRQLLQEAGAADANELPQLEARADERRRAEAALAEIEQRLTGYAEGEPLEAFVARAAAADRDTLADDIARAAQALEAIEQEVGDLREELGKLKSEFKAMDGRAAAAEANVEAQLQLSLIHQHAERYARLRLATVVLNEAKQRYQQRSRGPLLERASRCFRTLTCGSFERLQPDLDEQGAEILVGRRAGGDGAIPVAGMSHGVCDQLYLALQLAGLEEFLDRHEPMPLLVDDILVHFDDQRAVAALTALAELAQRTQVIFFTHHEHLLALAEAALPATAYTVQRLEGPLGEWQGADI